MDEGQKGHRKKILSKVAELGRNKKVKGKTSQKKIKVSKKNYTLFATSG